MQDEDQLTGPTSTDEPSIEPEVDETRAIQSVDQTTDLEEQEPGVISDTEEPVTPVAIDVPSEDRMAQIEEQFTEPQPEDVEPPEEPVTPLEIQAFPSEYEMSHIEIEPETEVAPSEDVPHEDEIQDTPSENQLVPIDEPLIEPEAEAIPSEDKTIPDNIPSEDEAVPYEIQAVPSVGDENVGISKDDEEWVMLDTSTAPATTEQQQQDEEIDDQQVDDSRAEEEVGREDAIQDDVIPTEDRVEEGIASNGDEPEEPPDSLDDMNEPTLGSEEEDTGPSGVGEPLSPYYERPVPSEKPVDDQSVPSDQEDAPIDDQAAQFDNDVTSPPESEEIDNAAIPEPQATSYEVYEPELDGLGSSFIPISVQDTDERDSETSSTAANAITPPLSMVVERGSPVPELTEPSVTSQDDPEEEEEDPELRDHEGEETFGGDEQEQFSERAGEGEGEEETGDDIQEQPPLEREEYEEEEVGDDVQEQPSLEEETTDDVQDAIVDEGDTARVVEGMEDDAPAEEEDQEGEDREEVERDEGDGGEEEGDGEELGDGEIERDLLEDDGSLSTPVQLQPDTQPTMQGSILDNLLDFTAEGAAAAAGPPPPDPFGMDPLELVTTPPHKRSNDIFGQDPFGIGSSGDQSYNPFAPGASVDPFSLGGPEFDAPLMDEPILAPGGLRPEGAGEEGDSGVQSPDILQPDPEEVGAEGSGFGDDQGIVAGESFGFESSTDPGPPEGDLLGSPVD